MLFDKTFGSMSLNEEFDIEESENLEKNEACNSSKNTNENNVSDEEVEESILFDDESYDLYESVCGQEEQKEEVNCQKSYEDMKKDAFAFGVTNDQIDGIIDKHLGMGAPDTVPDNVNILGTNTDDFEYDEDKSQDMDDDEDIDIVIDDDDIYDSDDK